jgi:hypothetical protein
VQVDANGDIWFRQSWLDTANRCNERGRLALIHPEEGSNDLAVCGTCTHAGIEAILSKQLDPHDAEDWVYEWALRYCEDNPIRWVSWTLPAHIAEHAARCTKAFTRGLLPHIEPGGQTEVEFRLPLFMWKDHQVGITGTVDYVPPSHSHLIDWKTASRKFDQRIKQRTAIQPTVYATAAVNGAFGPGFEWPITFRYGVIVRGREVATTQLLDVQRTHAHEGWLIDQMRTYCNMAAALGTDTHWPRDEDHYLCNETWCPWWSMCKGARLTTDQDNWSA